jgi:hypothetical protein
MWRPTSDKKRTAKVAGRRSGLDQPTSPGALDALSVVGRHQERGGISALAAADASEGMDMINTWTDATHDDLDLRLGLLAQQWTHTRSWRLSLAAHPTSR